MSDPLARALTALQALHAPKTDPVSVAFWEEVRDTLYEVLREREVLLEVVHKGRALIEVMDRYEMAHKGNIHEADC